MEAIMLGAAIGAGAMLVLRHGREGTKKLLGWTARQAGWISERVNASVDGARRVVREQYQKGRDETLERIAEMPPLSARNGNGKSMPPPATAQGSTATTNGKHPDQLS